MVNSDPLEKILLTLANTPELAAFGKNKSRKLTSFACPFDAPVAVLAAGAAATAVG